MNYKDDLSRLVDSRREEVCELSDKIWEFAESRFQEFKSVALQIEYFKKNGFRITENVGGSATAFIAEYGEGKPVIGFLGEYDALSGLSQKADCTCHDPIVEGGDGHGCGHNLIGAGCVSAVMALCDYIKEKGIGGTVRYYGCPAEENAGGKAFMVRDGAFDDCDLALAWHPGPYHYVNCNGSLANFRAFFTFHGKSAHAAGSPHLGRSALDAVELMNVGVNYMREHMIDQARVHYAVTNTGGTAPNVVQAEAQVLYAIRAPKVTQVKELYERVCQIAQGAALMTQTSVDIRQVAAYSDYIGNNVIQDRLREHMQEGLPLQYTEEEMKYAASFRNVITDLDKLNLGNLAKKIGGKESAKLLEMPIWNFLQGDKPGKGSTDVGDVSWVCPTGWFHAATVAAGTASHSWQIVAQGKSSVAHKGMLFAAKVLAKTGFEFLTDPELLEKARENWLEHLDGETYPNALPADAQPEIW
ncbi:MAG: amidohydrolase [Clostridia bacterium]|nr:amidohydrolase [Clostridia bacterium]